MGIYTNLYGTLIYGPSELNNILPQLKYYIGDRVPDHAVNLAYASVPIASAQDVVRVVNELNVSLSLISNCNTFKVSSSSGTIETVQGYSDYCIMTDKFNIDTLTSSSSKYQILSNALWYRHHLRCYVLDRPGLSAGYIKDTTASILSLTGGVLDNSSLYWRVHIDKVINSASGIYDCSIWTNFNVSGYKVRYTALNNMAHEESLNPMPLLFQADGTQTSVNKLTYLASPSGKQYNITSNYRFKASSVVAVKFPTECYFKVDTPNYITRDENWYLEIGRGQFYVGAKCYKNHQYYEQPFVDHMIPVIKVTKDKCNILTVNKIKTTHHPILCDYYDSSIYGTDVSYHFPVTVYVNNIPYSTKKTANEDFSEIVDIESSSGIITLPFDLKEGDKVTATYYVWQLYSQYRGFKNTSNLYQHLDVNPNYGHYVNLSNKNDQDDDSHHIVGAPISLWLNPSNQDGSKPPVNIYHTFSDSPNTNSQYTGYALNNTIRLAFVNITDYSYTPRLMDARSPGGGLKQNVMTNKDSDQYWDIGYWEGSPYQSNGVFVVDINNETLEKNHVKEIVDKYKAAGTLGLLTSRTGK